MSDVFCGDGQAKSRDPETGAIPAIGNFASHAIRQDINAPFDIPLKKIRRGSTRSSASSCWTSSVRNLTSSTFCRSAVAQQFPEFQLVSVPFGNTTTKPPDSASSSQL